MRHPLQPTVCYMASAVAMVVAVHLSNDYEAQAAYDNLVRLHGTSLVVVDGGNETRTQRSPGDTWVIDTLSAQQPFKGWRVVVTKADDRYRGEWIEASSVSGNGLISTKLKQFDLHLGDAVIIRPGLTVRLQQPVAQSMPEP